ncbi:thioredoxin family protein [Thiolapillus brandeum]|uniref:Thioredoxin n=1 Tax=Thiolapillus brandeum TaxID=1076588 RepID=A0A7U6GGG5_9GAMM|nr:thioredoxin fold domain-containing protein [Thiolapillus brandeum]BAO43188.1 thioredoxin [Thiolapillus brandeum]
MSMRILLLGLCCAGLLGWNTGTHASAESDPLVFDDIPLKDMVQHPDWFKDSFLDLQEDLAEAIQNGKKGIIVYFGQKRCPYCRQLMEVNFKQPDIVKYTRDNFDVVAIDIWSPEEVTDPAGSTMTQRDYALKMGTNFTPSPVFYDRDRKIALRLRGYYPPYQFRAALEYVAGGHYKREPFHVYLARGDSTLRFEADDMVEEEFFLPPPYNLDRSHFAAERPLAVFFEQGNCHACDILHTQLLRQPAIRKLFDSFESVQLNMHGQDPVITPDGRKLTAAQWARNLRVFYAPTLIFFDEKGQEIIRVDSVVHFFRLRNVLNFILTKGYLSHPSFQLWRSEENGR